MGTYIGYIGCWSVPEKSSIQVVRVNTDIGSISLLQVVEQASPSFLALSPNQKYLYAGGVSTTAPTSQRGEVFAYLIEPDGCLQMINHCASCSADGACHISVSNDGHYVYASHYDEGRAAIYCCRENGALFGPIQVIQHEGSGPHPQQDVPHIHYGMDTPDGKYVCFVDLALDTISIYRRLENGLLEKYCDGHTPRASGARHMTFSPDGRFAYVVSEMAADVSVYQYNDGRLKYLDTVSMLTSDHKGKMSGSAIHITPDGSFVYAGNRFANQIAAFRRDAKGYLKPIGVIPCALPRDIRISPDGRALFVCGSEDDLLEVFAIDPASGSLTKLNSYQATAPASICFLNAAL